MREVEYDEIREQKSFLGDLDSEGNSFVEEEFAEMTYGIREPKSLFVGSDEDVPWPIKLSSVEGLSPTISRPRSRKFDWAFGVILPIICFACDPIVFNNAFGSRGGILSQYTIFAYTLSIVSIMSMIAWMLWGERLGALTPVIGGLFMTASMVSLLVGILLFPVSLIGSVLIIGLFGFTPLFTSFVYYKHAFKALALREKLDDGLSRRIFVLTAILCFVIPFVINFQFVDPSLWLALEHIGL